MMKRILTMSLLAASVVACDPYSSYDFKSGPPAIKTVSLTSYGFGIGLSGAPGTGSAWEMDASCASVAALVCPNLAPNSCGSTGDQPCSPIDAWDPTLETSPMTLVVMFVTFDRQVDGGAVQTAVDDCTPAGASPGWLSVDYDISASGDTWMSCYTPGSPADYEGGSVVLFANGPPTPPATTVRGWSGAAELPDPTTASDITFTGTVAGTAIDVTLHREDLTACPVCPGQ